MLTFTQTSTPAGKNAATSMNAMASVTSLFGVGCLWFVVRALPSMSFNLTLDTAIGLGLGSLLFYLGRPWTLELDESKREYVLTRGYRPLLMVKTGGFDDIEGVQTLVGRSSRGGTLCQVLIMGKKLSSVGLPVDYFAELVDANARTAELAQQLGVPLLELTRTE
jgi:hypothetical protein